MDGEFGIIKVYLSIPTGLLDLNEVYLIGNDVMICQHLIRGYKEILEL